MQAYDDDEESLPVGFEQDPEEDEIGSGYWTRADGSRFYSKGDPELAKSLMKKEAPVAGAAPPLPSGAPLSEQEKAPLQASPEETQKLSDQLDGSPRKAAPAEAPEQPKPMAPLRAPGLPGASGPARYSDSAQAQRSASANQSASASESTTRSAMSQEDFDQQQGQTRAGYDQAIGRTDAGTVGQVSAIRQRAEQLAQLGRDKEAATAGALAQRDERANYVKAKIQEVGSRKTDMNGLWKEKGALGTTLGLLGVALRSITATKFGGPNTAMQSLQEQRKLNLQAQMEDRDSELRGLERELGSLDAAVPMLEARMRDAEAKRLEAMMADEKSQEVIANGNRLVSQLQIERDQKLAESAKAYYGTVAKQQATSQASTLTEGQSVERGVVSGAGVGGEGGSGAVPATAGEYPAVAEGLPEDESEEKRYGYAGTFKPDDPRDRKEISDYGSGKRTLEKLEATRKKLRSLYGVQPDKGGSYPDDGDYGSTATGPGASLNMWAGVPGIVSQRDRELNDAWTEVETNTRFDWKTEPNGQQMQNRLGQINVPKRDEDVKLKLQQLDKQIDGLTRSMDAETLPRVRAAYKLQRQAPYAREKTGGRRPGRIEIPPEGEQARE